ncbi:hypothetical protein MS3_00000541 [Schistosoma haematobium]|uniref:Uncharacterized protein n=1 Tax=Schistosoma haematobium TaxID=6185 RepID=A0A922LC36_SCHHA|nr:uncharacterized protein MS3_00000541 [Schistosoma haematobium]KAH9577891.1 hypothetical protein MS3_00000541 [Schistosoma haematobium]
MCDFGDQLHVQMEDQLDAGINIPNQERKLLQMLQHSLHDARTACISCEAVHVIVLQVINNPSTLLSYPNPMSTQVHTNMRLITDYPHPCGNTDKIILGSYKAGYISEYRFRKYLSCDNLLRDSCAFRHAKCFECDKMTHIKSVC